MIFLIVGIIFVLLKLAGKTRIEYWNWWSVCTPFFMAALLVMVNSVILIYNNRYGIETTAYLFMTLYNCIGISFFGSILKGFGVPKFKDLEWYLIAVPAFFGVVLFALATVDLGFFHLVLK